MDIRPCLALRNRLSLHVTMESDIFPGHLGLGLRQGDDVVKIGMELGGLEIGGFPALGEDPRGITEPNAV